MIEGHELAVGALLTHGASPSRAPGMICPLTVALALAVSGGGRRRLNPRAAHSVYFDHIYRMLQEAARGEAVRLPPHPQPHPHT